MALVIEDIAREPFLAWEKFRVAYVLMLAMTTILLTGPNRFLN